MIDLPSPLTEPFDAETEAAIEDDTEAMLRAAGRFVADRAGKWRTCSARTCRHARACRGNAPLERGFACGRPGPQETARICELAAFTLLDRVRRTVDGRF